jgi:hypothetical protein
VRHETTDLFHELGPPSFFVKNADTIVRVVRRPLRSARGSFVPRKDGRRKFLARSGKRLRVASFDGGIDFGNT